VSQQPVSGGLEQVDIRVQTTATSSVHAVLDVLLVGVPDRSGGVAVQQSQASFGPPTAPSEYQGRVIGLNGSAMSLSLAARAGTTLSLQVDLSISGSQVTGQLTASAPSGTGQSS
jgi:hypothetical protein